MARLTFRPGIRFQLRGEWFIVRDILLNRQFLVESQSVGGKSIKSLDELERAIADGELRFEVTGPHLKLDVDESIPINYSIQDFSALPESVQAEAWRLYTLIRPILVWPPEKRTRKNIENYVTKLKTGLKQSVKISPLGRRGSPRKGIKRGQALSRALLERKLKAYLNSGGDIRSLVDETEKIGCPGRKRLDPETDAVITAILDECERNRHYRTTESIYMLVVNRIAAENRTRPVTMKLKLPSRPTVYNRIHERGAENILRRRPSRVERQSSEPVQAGPDPTRIMERVEFDGTWLDLIVVDEGDRLPIGRPWFSYALDKYSGYPLGFYVGFEPPSYKTTMSCALHAFSLKADVRQLYGTKKHWFARGLPELAVIDNGKEYVNRHLQAAFGMLGILLDQCPVRTPWLKSSIERYIKTQNTSLIHMLPGSTFSNVIDRGDYSSEQYACISLSGLIQMLHIFLLDYYSQRWNKGVNGIPERLWCKSEQEGYIPSFPSSLEELKILLFWNDTRTLQRHGIEYETIVYQSNDNIRLRQLLRGDERKVEIRVNPDELNSIFVLDPVTKKEWLRFDANDPNGYTQGLSLWKHRVITRYLNNQKREVDIFALAEAKAKIQQIVDDEYFLTRKTKRRKPAARFLISPPPQQLPESIPSGGFTLAPDATIPQTAPENISSESIGDVKKPTKPQKSRGKKRKFDKVSNKLPKSSMPEDDDFDTSGWVADFRLPQNKDATVPSEEE